MQPLQATVDYDNASSFIIQQEKLFIGSKNNRPAPIHLIKYDHSQYDDRLYPYLKVTPPAQFDSWVSQRKAQFLSGRIAAQGALYATTRAKEVNILIGKYREPTWPCEFIGSISHSNDISIATAQLKNSQVFGVGLDIQTILSEQEALHVMQTVLTDSDRLLINQSMAGLSETQLLTLIFSAKESFFKAVFNSVREYFDFDAVTVHSISTESQQLSLKSNVSLSNDIQQGNVFKVAFNIIEKPAESVITYCFI